VTSFSLIFLIYLCVVVIVKIRVFRIRGEEGGTLHDNWTFPAIFLSYLVTVMGSLVEFFIRIPQVNLMISLSGYLLATAGVTLTRRSVMALGRWWSVRIEIKNHHQVVEDGPYRSSRHPYYLATILELGGLCLILNSFRALLYVFCIHIPLLIGRISSEEKMLVSFLGAPYLDYRKRVGVFPFASG
jgi:protein-S-isoprenylcysteine O-methyltransferase Ste14